MSDLIKPKEVVIPDIDGVERKFIISRFPATDGMEIFYRLPVSAIPKIGDFDALKSVRDDVFKFVAIEIENGEKVRLSTKALIDNHTGDAEVALKIIGAMLQYNFTFFQKGTISAFFDSLAGKIPDIAQKILTQLSPVLSKQSKQRSKS